MVKLGSREAFYQRSQALQHTFVADTDTSFCARFANGAVHDTNGKSELTAFTRENSAPAPTFLDRIETE